MADPNVFAILIPVDQYNLAGSAFSLPHNANRYHKPTASLMQQPTISSRDPTPEGDDRVAPGSLASQYTHVPQIILTFDNGPKDITTGWVFGTNQASCDVLLGYRGAKKISGRQFTISITSDQRIVLRDTSKYGTAVGYDGKAKDQSRINYTWTLALAPGTHQHWTEVIVYVPDRKGPAFIIDFPNHRVGEEKYLDNLDDYLAKRHLAVPTVGAMGLDSATTTAPPTDVPTPKKQSAVYFECDWIGEGSCGEVYKVTNTNDGQIYAAKYAGKLSNKNPKKRKINHDGRIEALRNEVNIMKKLDHDNVMRLVDFFETPQITLVMPYYRYGSLDKWCKRDGMKPKDHRHPQYRLKPGDRINVFIQILLGLAYLHEMDVAHRDLKPGNILVASIRPLVLVIADFGLAKLVEDSPLVTNCGTPVYTAPEVLRNNYGSKADIWSLGVLMAALSYGLPAHLLPTDSSQGRDGRWSKALVEFVADFSRDTIDNLIYVLVQMIKIEPERRPNAEQCFELGYENGLLRKRPDGTIVAGILETLYTDEEAAENQDRGTYVEEDGSTTPKRQSSYDKAHGGTVLKSGSTTPTQLPAQGAHEASDKDASTLRFGNNHDNSGSRKSQKTAPGDYNGSLGSWAKGRLDS